MNLEGQLDVVDLTTLARVHELMPASQPDTSQDAFISQTITDVSARIGRYIGLHLSVAVRTETYELAKHKRILRLDAKSLTDITSIKESPRPLSTADWTATNAISDENYAVHNAGGWVRFLIRRDNDPGYLQVVYTGGFGAAASNVIADYPELAHACDIQVKYLVERRAAIAGNITTIPGATTSYNSQYGLHREVKEIINMHRRGRV